jgi:glucose-1-phosphate adenylyltransferase
MQKEQQCSRVNESLTRRIFHSADFIRILLYNWIAGFRISKMAKVVTMIMAGGHGSRLFPLTATRSKPAVPIAGRFRLIDFPISNCIHSGFKKIFVLTQFSSESIHRHIFLTYRFDNFTRDFVTVLSAQQTLESRDWYQGTADAVRQNLSFLRTEGDLVLILSGDHLYRMDYRQLIDYHLEKKADITISVYPVTQDQAPQFGVMKVNTSGEIIDFCEKPSDPGQLEKMRVEDEAFSQFRIDAAGRTHLASMGVYVFNRDVLKELLENTEFEDFGREVIPHAIKGRKVFSYFFDGYWEDIGTIRSFFDAHIGLTQPMPRFNLYDEDKPIFSHARFLPGSKIISSEITNSILCEGSIIQHSKINHSIVGVRSRIGSNALLDHFVMMGANFFESSVDMEKNKKNGIPNVGLGDNCEIRNAIIDRNARIGNNVKLINADSVQERNTETYSIVDGIIVVRKNAIIPDGTVI